MTLTARKSRLEIIRIIADKSSEAVNSELKALTQNFQFNSITSDNVIEFVRLSEADKCDIYYAQADSSWERGSNENHILMICRFLPKGTIKTTTKEVGGIEIWMNDYPRKMFNYSTPIQVYLGG